MLGLGSCLPTEPTGSLPRAGETTLLVRADLSGTAAATVVVEVTAPDFATAMVFNIPIVNRVATGTITLQAGSSRTITMRAFDAGGVQTHRGSVTVNIQPGTNPTISIVLMPLTSDVSINATLGSFTVTVAPAANMFFFFKQKTAYEIGLGIPAEPLFRSSNLTHDFLPISG